VLFDQQPIHVADDLSLARLDHDVRRRVMPSRQIAVPITMIGPRHIFAAAGFLQPSPPGALENLRALILGDHPLHLGEQFTLGRVPKGVVQKEKLYLELL
jgi:hypothetical protein